MVHKEQWVNVHGFDNYLISDQGRCVNAVTDHLKIPTVNQQGIPSFLLMQDGKPYRRSVAVLVAEAFLEPHELESCDTPVNINGDRLDNRVENLMWRPRWFAVKYHQERKMGNRKRLRVPIYEVETEEIFDQPWQAAIRWGLLEGQIIESITNRVGTFPGNHFFAFLPEEDELDIN